QRQSSEVGRQLAETRGLVGYSFRAKFSSHRFWTLSIWEDEQALMAFVSQDPHRTTMGLLQPTWPRPRSRDGRSAVQRSRLHGTMRFGDPKSRRRNERGAGP